jgi:hypothetical protein
MPIVGFGPLRRALFSLERGSAWLIIDRQPAQAAIRGTQLGRLPPLGSHQI